MPLIGVHGELLPRDWVADIDAFVGRLATHVWGGDPNVRLVAADDVAAALEEWMTPEAWDRDSAALARYDSSAAMQIGGKAFLAHDGVWTAVVGNTSEKELFLMLVGHELVEAAIEQRQHAADETWDGVSPEAQAHVLWSEYVVERVRAELARDLGFGLSSQETCRPLLRALTATAKPAMVSGFITAQAWHELMIMWARVLGRTDGGQQQEAADLKAFYESGVIADVAPLWKNLETTLRQVYKQPDALSGELDQLVVPNSDLVFSRRPRPPC